MGKILVIKGADFSAVAVAEIGQPPVITINSLGGVTITANGAIGIYYTTDGSIPKTSSSKYTSSFTVSKGVTVNAIAEYDDGTTSSVSSKIYYGGSETDITSAVTLVAGKAWSATRLNDSSVFSHAEVDISSYAGSYVKITFFRWTTSNNLTCGYGCYFVDESNTLLSSHTASKSTKSGRSCGETIVETWEVPASAKTLRITYCSEPLPDGFTAFALKVIS